MAGKESPPSQAITGDGSLFDPNSAILPIGGNPQGGSSKPEGPGDGKEGKPGSPSGLRAKSEGMSVQLSWNASPSSEQVTQYTVYYSNKENGSYRKLGTSPINGYLHMSNVTEGFYRVTAENRSGESPPSSSIEVKK
ncbi:fibronectin type III domain-containing protein [Paenibacillus sp. CC-CFT747]|nr:fibronectin type III domain-containing protein [Paenibacillus sp. CC-CFT747]